MWTTCPERSCPPSPLNRTHDEELVGFQIERERGPVGHSRSEEEVCVGCTLGSFRFEVSLPSDEFAFVGLKRDRQEAAMRVRRRTRRISDRSGDPSGGNDQEIRRCQAQPEVLGLVLGQSAERANLVAHLDVPRSSDSQTTWSPNSFVMAMASFIFLKTSCG